MSGQNHVGLGEFLRSRRERLRPEVVGLANGRRRRATGLRREEVAELAGIGIDWYTRLEQGRAVKPSATTIDALAAALRLDEFEHAHLRALAGNPGREPFRREEVPAPLRRLVLGMAQPAYLTGRRWDLLVWNAAAADVFGDFGRLPRADRNILVYLLTEPAARRLFADTWLTEAQRVVAQFRVTHDLWADDPAFARLTERLRQHCPEFSALWQAHEVRAPSAGRKTLHHPTRGVLRFEHATFQANDDPALKLTVYTPVDNVC